MYFSVFEKLWSRPSKLTSAYWAVWDLAVFQIMLPAPAASLPGTPTAAAHINYMDSTQNAVLQTVCLQLHSSPSSCWCLLAYPSPRKDMLESFDGFHWFSYRSISMLHDRYIRNVPIAGIWVGGSRLEAFASIALQSINSLSSLVNLPKHRKTAKI